MISSLGKEKQDLSCCPPLWTFSTFPGKKVFLVSSRAWTGPWSWTCSKFLLLLPKWPLVKSQVSQRAHSSVVGRVKSTEPANSKPPHAWRGQVPASVTRQKFEQLPSKAQKDCMLWTKKQLGKIGVSKKSSRGVINNILSLSLSPFSLSLSLSLCSRLRQYLSCNKDWKISLHVVCFIWHPFDVLGPDRHGRHPCDRLVQVLQRIQKATVKTSSL